MKMLTKMKLALAVAAPLVAGVTTYAVAGGNGRHGEIARKFDQNADGQLDDSERAQMKAFFQAKRAAHHQEMLAKYDANQDGKLDRNERVAMRDDKLTARFQKLDANHDGAVSLEEFKARARLRHGHRMHHRMRDAGGQPGPAESGLSQLPDAGGNE